MKETAYKLTLTVLAAIDAKKFEDITIGQIEQSIKDGQFVRFLNGRLANQNLGYDIFPYVAGDLANIDATWVKELNVFISNPKYSGVTNSGLCLAAGALAHVGFKV